ncbi:hypothetical protein H1Q63_05800 [Desmonostoc muscorum CCALA 125]|nr:hypothetical protein [Desmonostoc muscorum CCALA 125]
MVISHWSLVIGHLFFSASPRPRVHASPSSPSSPSSPHSPLPTPHSPSLPCLAPNSPYR